MSNQPDLSMLSALYREIGQIVNIPTRRETLLSNHLDAILTLARPECLPGELPTDAALRLIRDGITYNAMEADQFLDDQQKQVQKSWAEGNGVK